MSTQHLDLPHETLARSGLNSPDYQATGHANGGDIHRPLPDLTTHIRLLRSTGDWSHDAEFTLTVWPLDAHPEYRAISYTWGEPQPCLMLYINGKAINVRWNCHYALWQSHLHRQDSYLWIDSLCIYQNDLEEKGAQVAMMWDIFSTAVEVLICVGPHAHGSEVLSELDWIPDSIWSCTKPFDDMSSPWVQFLLPLHDGSHPRLEQCFAAWSRLVEREYWRRTWIVQEVISGSLSSRIMLCGDSIITWRANKVFKYIDYVAACLGLDVNLGSITFLAPLKQLMNYEANRHSTGSNALSKVLSYFQNFRCANPRDRLYAMLPFINQSGLPRICTDYTVSTFDLAVSVVGLHIDFSWAQQLLQALEIECENEQMKAAVELRKRGRVSAPPKLLQDPLPSGGQHQKWFCIGAIAAVTLSPSGSWTSDDFVKDSEQYVQKKYTYALQCEEHLPAKSDQGRAVRLYMDGKPACLACEGTSFGVCDIIGQAVTLPGYRLRFGVSPAVKLPRHSKIESDKDWYRASMSLEISAEDTVVLRGQDRRSDEEDHIEDTLRRVWTDVTIGSPGVARLSQDNEDYLNSIPRSELGNLAYDEDEIESQQIADSSHAVG